MKRVLMLLITGLVLAGNQATASQPSDSAKPERMPQFYSEMPCEIQEDVLERARLLLEPDLWRLAGEILQVGRCTEKDLAAAAMFYIRAVDMGDRGSSLHLGRLYALGLGVEIDEQEARHHFRTWVLDVVASAAEKREAWAREGLGPFEVPRLLEEELAWAAELDRAPAERKYRVALKLLVGDGLPLNRRAARHLLSLASSAGHTAAHFELGRGYLERKFPLSMRTREETVSNGLSKVWEPAYRGYRPAQIYLARYCLAHYEHDWSKIGALVLLLRAARNGDTALDPEIKVAERGLSKEDLDYARRQAKGTDLLQCWLGD